MKRISLVVVALAAVLALCSSGCGGDPSTSSTLTIRNNSSFTFTEINLSPIDQADWGPDLLGAQLLEPGDVLELGDIDCDVYDIRVVDENTDECVLTDVDLCLDDAVWVIDDAELFACGL